MKRLELPAPAAELWTRTRDILTSLGPEGETWTPYLGGGTVLVARTRHRASADIDVVLRNTRSLVALIGDNDHNLARRLGGTPKRETTTQIKVEMAAGVIDLNLAPVHPAGGAELVEISGRPQHVLSTTQILHGKLKRAANPGPVRDVYDMIRLSLDRETAGALAAAYALLTETERDGIERLWEHLDRWYETRAEEQLLLHEAPATDLAKLGTTGAAVLNAHRLNRVTIELADDRVITRRATRGAGEFIDESSPETVAELYSRNGIEETLTGSRLSIGIVAERIRLCRNEGVSGVVYDSVDPDRSARFMRLKQSPS